MRAVRFLLWFFWLLLCMLFWGVVVFVVVFTGAGVVLLPLLALGAVLYLAVAVAWRRSAR